MRDIYRRVANVQHPGHVAPARASICPTCGKVGTTIVTDWDGERVFYECRAGPRDLGARLRHVGLGQRRSAARAKLPWNLEWAAQWSLFGVTIEPCGKDLSTAGGSRDRSDAIAREVFEREPPLNVPYEFLNIGGKKMSTSKGRGAAAHTIAEVVPPEQLRFLFLRPRPNQAIDFDPDGTDAIPRLFDEFDRFAAATAGREVKGEMPPGFEATFRYSLLDPNADVAAEAAAFRPAFAHLALLVQIPGVDVAGRVEAEKGSAADRARDGDPRRARRGRARLARDVRAGARPRRASTRTRCRPRRPSSTTTSARYLAALADAASRRRAGRRRCLADRASSPSPTSGRPAGGRAFAALYAAFLGRTNGPRAGWLLASLDPAFVVGACARPPQRGRRPVAGMSVGLQRLREEPDVIRDGRHRQGRGPGARRPRARARRASGDGCSARPRRSRPSATPPRSGSARRSRRGAAPDGPEVADAARRARPRPASGSTTLDAELADDRGRARRPAPAHPEPARPGHPGRWRGGQRHDPDLGRAAAARRSRSTGEVGADAPAGGATWPRRPHWEIGEALDILDLARGAKIAGSGLPGLQGRRLGAPARR